MIQELSALTAYWDAQAATYDDVDTDEIRIYWQHTATNVVLTRTEHQETDIVMDLGCGTGNVALTLAPHVKRVIGVDCSPNMIAIARAKAEERDLKNTIFTIGDLRMPPAIPGLTTMTACYALSSLDEAERLALWELAHRRLPEGGMFVIGDLYWNVHPDECEGIDGWMDPEWVVSARSHGVMKELEDRGFRVVLESIHPVVSVLSAMRL